MDEYTAESIVQRETLPRSSSSGCPVNRMDPPPLIHVPTFYAHTSVPGETPEGRSFSSSGCSSVAQSDLVSQDTGMPSQPTSTPSTNARHCHQPRRPIPPTGGTGLYQGNVRGCQPFRRSVLCALEIMVRVNIFNLLSCMVTMGLLVC